MKRNKRYTNALSDAACVLFLTVACIGCGQPMLYHFKHYHTPFAAIAESNKSYFHSSQTGRIIPKEECATYCEPGCFGYEPTTWTRWPSECPGNFPVQGEVISEVPLDGAISEEPAVSVGEPGQANSPFEQSSPIPAQVEPAPSVQVPSIPTDVESSVPSPSDASPSDASQRSGGDVSAEPEAQVASTKMHHRLDSLDSDLPPRVEIESPGAIARKVIPPKKRANHVEFKSTRIDAPTVTEKKKPEFVLNPLETDIMKAAPQPAAPGSSASLAMNPEPAADGAKAESKPVTAGAETAKPEIAKLDTAKLDTAKLDTAKSEIVKSESVKLETATVRLQAQSTPVAPESVAVSTKPVKVEPKAAKKDHDIAVIRVSDPGHSSQLRFATQPTMGPGNRMSAVADDQTLIRFR